MPDINITVAHKVAVSDTQSIVCDNSDYTVHWALDEEWRAYDTKTMRTIYMDGTFEDKVFSGDTIELPVCTVPGVVQIGLFAGDIRTSRVVILRALPSVRSAAGAPADPTESVYDQLMERMAQLETSDWAQNDPTAKDYVKNRTHWVERAQVKVLEGATFTISDDQKFVVFEGLAISPRAGDEFVVSLDGKTYTRSAALLSNEWGGSIVVVGNQHILSGDFPDTAEPFVLAFDERRIVQVAGKPRTNMTILMTNLGEHTVSVEGRISQVHPLPDDFMPDDCTSLRVLQYNKETDSYEILKYANIVTFGTPTSIAKGEVMYDPQDGKFRLYRDAFQSAGTIDVKTQKSKPSVGSSVTIDVTDTSNLEIIHDLGSNDCGAGIVIRFAPAGLLEGYLSPGRGGCIYDKAGGLYGVTAVLNDAETAATITIKRLM